MPFAFFCGDALSLILVGISLPVYSLLMRPATQGPTPVKRSTVETTQIARGTITDGWGCKFENDAHGTITIKSVDDSSSAKGQVKVGDVVLKINGKKAVGDVAFLMHGLAAALTLDLVVERFLS